MRIRTELKRRRLVLLPERFDKSRNAAVTYRVGNLLYALVGVNQKLGSFRHAAVFQIGTDRNPITQGKAKLQFLLVQENFFA